MMKRMPKYPTDDPNYRLIRRTRSRYTRYYFYIRDEVLGPLLLCVGYFLPLQTTYYLNGHHVIAGDLRRHGIPLLPRRQRVLVDVRSAALQAAPDRLSPAVIRQRLEYWTLVSLAIFSGPREAPCAASA